MACEGCEEKARRKAVRAASEQQAPVARERVANEAHTGEREAHYTAADALRDFATGVPMAPDDIVNARRAICDTCENLIPMIRICTLCGCSVRLKTLFQRASCPASKWLAHTVADEEVDTPAQALSAEHEADEHNLSEDETKDDPDGDRPSE